MPPADASAAREAAREAAQAAAAQAATRRVRELRKAIRRERESVRREGTRHDDRLQEEIRDLRQDRKLRQEYARKLFWLVVAWLTVLWLVVLADGFRFTRFNVDADVLRLLVASTTASVLGLFAIVANYLFPRR